MPRCRGFFRRLSSSGFRPTTPWFNGVRRLGQHLEMEFVAALRGSLDENKPSLFEVLAEQQLAGLLPPTVRYLLTIATQRHPRYLLRILNSFDELYSLSMLLVERHYLRTRGGSFTDHFYGLKREKAVTAEIPRASIAAPRLVSDALKLTTADVWKNLAVIVGLPYLKRKLDESYDINAPRALLGSAYTRMPDNPSLRDRFLHYYRWFLRNIYPSVNAAYYFSLLAFNMAYLFDRSSYHSPFMWLIGSRLRRMTRTDYLAIESLLERPKSSARPGPRSIFSPSELGSRALSGLSMLLPMSIFALKFLEWWHQSDFAKQLSRKAAEHVDLPPPILPGSRSGCEGALDSGADAANQKVPSEKSPGQKSSGDESHDEIPAQDAPIATPSMLPIHVVRVPKDTSACPICRDDIITPTACQTGIVYCYSCIHRWVEGIHPKQENFIQHRAGQWESGRGRCAVTGRRVLGGTEGLRRIII
ncbi:hypothetical protein XA68_12878 [Ophiocordyceps unilateralis]|uniref:Peroxisome assembly protein 12 n=1 Tax=Ophiocordyceps unilateralis TaxID=268505 RepID=A0A2A9PDV4_OPHUN|nr:hypothetical protein XA68_12878 [Ophiocordyceps unilateralis]